MAGMEERGRGAEREKRVKTHRDAEVVLRLQAWLRRAMSMQSPPISAEAWGTRAGVSPTAITRFLKHGYPVPKTSTLARLADALGLPAPDAALYARAPEMVEIPVILGAIWRQNGLQTAMEHSVDVTTAPRAHAGTVAIRVNTDHGALLGVLRGDLVLVRPNEMPRSGQLAVVVNEAGEVSVLRCEPPVLRAAAIGSHHEVPDNDPGILGVVVQLQRDLP